jgi:hypothetical protein
MRACAGVRALNKTARSVQYSRLLRLLLHRAHRVQANTCGRVCVVLAMLAFYPVFQHTCVGCSMKRVSNWLSGMPSLAAKFDTRAASFSPHTATSSPAVNNKGQTNISGTYFDHQLRTVNG